MKTHPTLTVKEATLISNIMDHIKECENPECTAHLMDELSEVKRRMISNEHYEAAAELKRLEELHELDIPLKV